MTSTPSTPAPSAGLEGARRRRAALLARELFFKAQDLQRLGYSLPPAREGQPRRRLPGLISFWSGCEFLYPRWQFQGHTFVPRSHIATLLGVLPEDPTGWRLGFWLYQRHSLLNGARPADAFVHNPQNVLLAARSDFEPNDTRW
jgi:hypothetical protein